MSRKARHCLQGFLDVFDTLSDHHHSSTYESVDAVTTADGLDTLPYLRQNFAQDTTAAAGGGGSFSQFVAQSADEFLFQCSQDAFLDAEFGVFQH